MRSVQRAGKKTLPGGVLARLAERFACQHTLKLRFSTPEDKIVMLDLTHAIVKITSTTADNTNFGTGFVIHRDQSGDYLLTCKHVVNAVGKETIAVDGHQAEKIAGGQEDGLDLAVLRMDPGLLQVEPLRLSTTFSPNGLFVTRGYHRFETKIVNAQGHSEKIGLTLSDKLTVRLESQTKTQIHHAGVNIPTFRLKVKDPDFPLLPGYSGAPLIDEVSGAVVGVISIRENLGQSGLAISAQGVQTLWPEQAALLFREVNLQEIFKEPVMNLERELPAFKRIVAQENQETRLINIYGESGRGKTLLLELYRLIAQAHHISCLPFELGETDLTFEKCLDLMVSHFGPENFPRYDEFASQGRGNMPEDQWQRNLTRKFFIDANSCNTLTPLLVLFDSYNADMPEKSFKRWLAECLCPNLRNNRALLVVVAGQEQMTTVATIESCCQTFELQCLSLRHFHDYAAQRGVNLPPPVIETLYHKENGRPKLFVEMVQAFTATPGGAA